MRKCVCGNEWSDDVHFCTCGEFLAWDAPPVEAAGSNGAATTAVLPATATAAEERVSVQLFHAGEGIEKGPVTIGVPAGGRVHLMARVRNESDIVDSYDLAVEGMPADWWTVEPHTSNLMSRDSTEGYEEDVVVALHPPRSPQALAGRWTVAVVATSRANPKRRGFAQAGVDVEPFREMAVEPRPETVTGTRRARMAGVVENQSNTPLPVTLGVIDAEDRCAFDILDPSATLGPGERAAIDVVVRPRKLHWIGRRIEHRLTATATAAGEEPLTRSAPALFRQRPLIAWWVPLLLLMLLLAAIILWLLWPERATVPDVRQSRSAFKAQQKLEREGLELDPAVRTVRARRDVRPGTVIDQAPKPGTEVEKGKPVGIVVVAGRTKLKVPDVTHLRIAQAEERLQNAGFTLGAVTPRVDPKARIRTQVPVSNVLRRRGTPVNVVLADRIRGKPDEKPKMKPASAKAADEVPKVAGQTAAAAAAALRAAGLTPVIVPVIDPAKPGTVLRTEPPEGEPPPDDGVVKLIVSAGYPRIAYDNGSTVQLADGVTGKPVFETPPRGTVGTGGAWSPDGRDVAYASDGRLFLADPVSDPRPQRVAVPSDRRVTDPTFAPSQGRKVLAFVDRNASGGDKPDRNSSGGDELCWADVTFRRATTVSCKLVRAGWTAGGIAWHPEGTELLVSVSRGTRFGLVRLTTRFPSSSRADRWRVEPKLATRTESGGKGIRAAAFRPPDGKRVAVVTNLQTVDFRIALAKADDLKARPTFLPLPGCDVAWRQDGLELAIVQAGSLCLGAGPVVRVRPDDPRTIQTLALLGAHPGWERVDLKPGPGR